MSHYSYSEWPVGNFVNYDKEWLELIFMTSLKVACNNNGND